MPPPVRPRLAVAHEHPGGPRRRDGRVPRDARQRDELVEGAAGGVVVAGEVEAAEGVAVAEKEFAWAGRVKE